MATFRQVHTKMWQDNWFCELPAEQKLVWVYLFTNERASVSGIYELPIRTVAFETGLQRSVIEEALEVFSDANRAYYDKETGVVWVVNLRKYHETPSPKLQTKIMKDIAAVPDCKVFDAYLEAYGIDRVSIRSLYMSMSGSMSSSTSGLSGKSIHGRMPTPLSDTLPDQMIAALADVTGMDPYVIEPRRQLENTSAMLLPRYKPDQVKKRYGQGGEWYDQAGGHWKGQKGQPPTLRDITTTIGMGAFNTNGADGKPPAATGESKAEKVQKLLNEAELDY